MGFFAPSELAPLLQRANRAGIVVSEWDYDAADDRMILKRRQDIEPILERNFEQYALDDTEGWTPSRDMRRVANIPNVTIEQWMREGINIYKPEDWPKIRARLNDPSYLRLRTAPGRI